MKTLLKTLAELPLSVVGLLALAHSQYDTAQENAHWAGSGSYPIVAYGVTTGLTLWNVTRDVAEVDGGRVEGIRLTKRENFHTGNPVPPVDYFVPFESLRGLVGIELTLAVEAS